MAALSGLCPPIPLVRTARSDYLPESPQPKECEMTATMTATTTARLGPSDEWVVFDTPVGKMMAAGDDEALRLLHLPGSFDAMDLPWSEPARRRRSWRRSSRWSRTSTTACKSSHCRSTRPALSSSVGCGGLRRYPVRQHRELWAVSGENRQPGGVPGGGGGERAEPHPAASCPATESSGRQAASPATGVASNSKQRLLDHERATLA